MKESHEDVERALRVLGQVRTPEGMEARIAGETRRRQAEMAARGASGSQISWARWSFAAAVIVLLALMVRVELHPRQKSPAPVQSAHVEAPVHAESLVVRRDVHSPLPMRSGKARPRVERVRERQSAVVAPSQVAPPLPLTQQERLLVALAHTPEAASSRVLTFITSSETIPAHGLGRNAIFELDHQELHPMPSIPPGEIE